MSVMSVIVPICPSDLYVEVCDRAHISLRSVPDIDPHTDNVLDLGG